MGQEFTTVAQSRARYYCKGSPVQFVRVELLRVEDTGELVVTLTFKNLAPQNQPLTGFTAHFRCKDAQGAVVMEDDFAYTDLDVHEGELFGGDDAVYVSSVPLSSVEVNLVSVDYGTLHHGLRRCPPVPLTRLQPLPKAVAAAVNSALQMDTVRYTPANVEDGWQCSCGAFNYNVGRGTVMCTECGADKAALFSAVREATRPEQTPQMLEEVDTSYLPVIDDEMIAQEKAKEVATAVDNAAEPYVAAAPQKHSSPAPFTDGMDDRTRVVPTERTRAAGRAQDEEMTLMKNRTADLIIKYAPFITAGASVAYVMVALIIHLIAG